MTKKELIDALKEWEDDTVIEISVSTEADMIDPHYECEQVWHELNNVEKFEMQTGHCLLIAGKVTMC